MSEEFIFNFDSKKLIEKDGSKIVDLSKDKFNMQQFRSAVIDAGKLYKIDPNKIWTDIPKFSGKSHANLIANKETGSLIIIIRSVAEMLKEG